MIATTATERVHTTRSVACRRVLRGVVAATGGLLVIAAAWFFATGGRFFVVESPSMGTTAPVGTLVLTRPIAFAEVHVGDIISFHPPTAPDETYTHRVVAVAPDGGLRTRGDINGAEDSWTLHDRDVVGSVVLLPGLGWLIRALPMLVFGGLLVWLFTARWVSERHRGSLRLLGGTLVVSATVAIVRPLLGVTQLASETDDSGASKISAVSTGLLPVRLSSASEHVAPLDLHYGQQGWSVLRGGLPDGTYQLDASLHLTGLSLLIAIVVCASPLAWAMVASLRSMIESRRAVVTPV